MEIRKAEAKDVEQILGLLSQVLAIHAEIRPDIFNEGVTKYRKAEIEEMLVNETTPIYVATEGDEVLAYAFCQIRVTKFPHLMKRKIAFHIDDFCVDEKHRRGHLGETLFQYVKEEAIAHGCEEITLNCWEGNDAAKSFYEKMGLKTRSSIMECPIR